jgi:hypothetical protein
MKLRRVHLIAGLLATLAFVLTGQWMHRGVPFLKSFPADVHLMYVSRHIYIAGAAMVNVCLGLYLQMQATSWRKLLQIAGSIPVLFSPVLLTLAFFHEPALGIAGRSWRTQLGIIPMIIGVGLHFVASIGAKADKTEVSAAN